MYYASAVTCSTEFISLTHVLKVCMLPEITISTNLRVHTYAQYLSLQSIYL